MIEPWSRLLQGLVSSSSNKWIGRLFSYTSDISVSLRSMYLPLNQSSLSSCLLSRTFSMRRFVTFLPLPLSVSAYTKERPNTSGIWGSAEVAGTAVFDLMSLDSLLAGRLPFRLLHSIHLTFVSICSLWWI